MAVVRTVQIITTFRAGYPSLSDLYQPGTIVTAEYAPGRTAGKIVQLQIFTNSRAVNGINLTLEDMNGNEYLILENIRIQKSASPVQVLPLLGQERGFFMSPDMVMKASVIYPQNIADSFITISGFAVEILDDALASEPFDEVLRFLY